ncbi:MAG: hypothetical protein RBT62_12055 [Spirochaetia bacterium]|jgi:hypothetical protein|nr:hypothetical protein [Spirochaetia bacterium]
MKVKHVALVLMLVGTTCAFGQSNQFIDILLETDSLSAGQAAYLVLVASERLDEKTDEAGAFKALIDLGWVSEQTQMDTPMRTKDYCYLLMKAFDLKGGLLYSLFPGPRYAYRQMVSSQVIQGRSDPAMVVTGSRAMRMLGRVFDIQEISS